MTTRLETFADGVFAIAATLLILDVALPEHLEQALGRELLVIWPQYLAYAISFATIGIIWVNHHAVLAQVGRADRLFLFLNLGLLLTVAFIPFPTRVLAEFVRTDDGRAAALLYGLTMLAMSLAFLSVWLYASREADSCDLTPIRGRSAGSREASCPACRCMQLRPLSPSCPRRLARRSSEPSRSSTSSRARPSVAASRSRPAVRETAKAHLSSTMPANRHFFERSVVFSSVRSRALRMQNARAGCW